MFAHSSSISAFFAHSSSTSRPSSRIPPPCLVSSSSSCRIYFNSSVCILSGEVRNNVLYVGDVSAPVYGAEQEVTSSSAAKIPDVLFYDNAQHLSVMKDMLQDYVLGDHILLVGNQVGL